MVAGGMQGVGNGRRSEDVLKKLGLGSSSVVRWKSFLSLFPHPRDPLPSNSMGSQRLNGGGGAGGWGFSRPWVV